MTTTSERPPARQVSQRVSQSVFDGSRLRVVLLVDVNDGAQQQFLEAYEQLCHHVASVPGHVSDQLCQSIENPSQWLITSEWESAPPFLAWVNSEEHVRMVRPLHGCVRDTRSLRFHVVRETSGEAPGTAGQLQASPRIGDGIIRHALTFTVKPGSEQAVAKILADYASPEPHVDDTTRLCRTSLFMHGNRVVRAIEVRGDLLAALRHVARQPQVRAVEEAINPHLEQDRDLDDPDSARVFFTRAALPAVHHVTTDQGQGAEGERHALYYPARPGEGMRLAQLLAQRDEAAAEDPRNPVLRSTIFQRDEIVVRLLDVRGGLEADAGRVLGLTDARQVADLTTLLDGEGAVSDGVDLRKVVALARMEPITDRCSPEE
ncbi:TcmI family type II polyketide cyclase [Streptomyces sp. Ru71]|uniref:SchA/CurD-like domain-containing protein n=1 Tax=Streptomyces sp. Ru71 TaxID=2080746 RepID=UPI000CDE3DE5|nr:SchA/CurD-like domain-containing protein [Streptomyces sp. Ru71]POX51351.1 TcmI family type II polyketide cyclase [Streptomyces sp. Ru71]